MVVGTCGDLYCGHMVTFSVWFLSLKFEDQQSRVKILGINFSETVSFFASTASGIWVLVLSISGL